MDFKVTPFGFDKLKKKLDAIGSSMVRSVAPELTQVCEECMTEAKGLTPVEWGTLRGTGHVEEPVISINSVKVRMAFGGPAAPYAVFVHEDPEAFHDEGIYKYLEVPVMEFKVTGKFQDAIRRGAKKAFTNK